MKNMASHCDIILYDFYNLSCLNECIHSILNHTRNYTYTLHIFENGCDTYTKQYLLNCSERNFQVAVHRDIIESDLFERVNHIVLKDPAPYVVIMTGDVMVAHEWLERVLGCMESDPMIGAVTPFANHSPEIGIQPPAGSNFLSLNEYLKQMPQKGCPDVAPGEGICMLYRRDSLNEVGGFDTGFSSAYYRNLDMCIRFFLKGYRTVLAEDVYVCQLQQKPGSYQNHASREDQDRFLKKWGKDFKKKLHPQALNTALEKYDDILAVEKEWAPEPCLRQAYRQIRSRFQQSDYSGGIKEIISGIKKLPFAWREVVSSSGVSKFSSPRQLRVTYILPALTIAGGVLSVVQLVNELILLGVDARIATLRAYPEIYDWKFFFSPMIFKNRAQLIQNFPETDIAVATHFSTVSWVDKLVRKKLAKTSFYFLQDYEAWFFSEADKKSRSMVKKSYDRISNKVVKSDWLDQRIESDGYKAQKIRLGMDLLTFYPRDVKKNKNPVLFAMARPRTPRRGFKTLIETLAIVKQEADELDIVLFGDDLTSYPIPFDYTDKKIISNQSSLAEMYSQADIFFDSSDFQGFGRTALEAMACGAACVLTNVGGVSEYAVNGENCFLVPPKAPALCADAILTLIKNKIRREQIQLAGLNTVKEYCHKREAKQTLEYIEALMDKSGKTN